MSTSYSNESYGRAHRGNTLQNLYHSLKRLPTWAIVVVYTLLASVLSIVAITAPLSPDSRLSAFLIDWQTCFHPVQMLLLKYNAFLLSDEYSSVLKIADIGQIRWGWHIVFVIIDLVALVILAAAINIIAIRLFELHDRFKDLLRKLFSIHVITSLLFGIPAFAITAQFQPGEVAAKRAFILISLLISLWLIAEFKRTYLCENKRALLLYLVVFPLFPIAGLLLAVYAFSSCLISKNLPGRRSARSERGWKCSTTRAGH
jgi:hypothetical protein